MGLVPSAGATGQKRKGSKSRRGTGHGGGEVAAALPPGGAWTGAERRGAREKCQKRGARAALELGAMRGVKCSRRWRGAAGNSGERQSRGTEERQRKKREGGGPRDLVGVFKNLRDSTEK
jgi:hypothetical protein